VALTGKVASQEEYLKSLGAAEVVLKIFYVIGPIAYHEIRWFLLKLSLSVIIEE
jgi:hypothetical protein